MAAAAALSGAKVALRGELPPRAAAERAVAATQAPALPGVHVVDSKQLCRWLTAVQLLASVVALGLYGLGDVQVAPDPREISHFHNAKVMLLPALLLEVCYVLSASWQHIPSRLQKSEKKAGQRAPDTHLHGYYVAMLVILEYLVKMITYASMARWNGLLVHSNRRAWGRPRACYTMRFVEWSVAVPILLSLNNHPFMGGRSIQEFCSRLVPNLMVTFAYIVASWAGQVVDDAAAGWFLVFVSFVGYAIAVIDQVSIVQDFREGANHFHFKLGVVILKEVIFSAYGVVYFVGIFNLVSSVSEQAFYTYCDVLLKVVQAACLVMIRNWEDLLRIQDSLEMEVEVGREDVQRLIGKANVPILSLGSDGCITGWNENIAKISCIPREKAVGRPFTDLAEAEHRDAITAAIKACAQGGYPGAIELSLLHPKEFGEECCAPENFQPVQLFMTFVQQLGGAAGSIVVLGQDLTDLASMKNLQERKARFTAVMSHELRSPLHGITGLSGAMAEATEDAMQKRQLTMIQGCAARLLDLVTNIMDMALVDNKASGGTEELPKAPVNFMDIADEVVSMTRMAVDKSGKPLVGQRVSLVNDMCTGTLPLVQGDACKFSQLLYNLVTNACKFTAKGSVTLSARHCKQSHMLEIDVADTGKGISPCALEKIFQPFEQENAKDSKSFQGIGLGLSVADGIAKLYGGEITVKSTVGEGSTFTVRLPCDEELPAKGLTVPAPTGAEEHPGISRAATLSMNSLPDKGDAEGKPLLLSVDDDDINQEVVQRALGSNYRIAKAMNGMEALEFLSKTPEVPCAVLLDVMMPGLTGFEVCNEIRQRLKYSHLALPVIIMSAKSPAEETAKEAFQSGATDFMQKPFSTKMLKMRLRLLGTLKQEMDARMRLSRSLTMGAVSGDLEDRGCRSMSKVWANADLEAQAVESESQAVLEARAALEAQAALEAKVEEQERSWKADRQALHEEREKFASEAAQCRAALEQARLAEAKVAVRERELVDDKEKLKKAVLEVRSLKDAVAAAEAKAEAAIEHESTTEPGSGSRAGGIITPGMQGVPVFASSPAHHVPHLAANFAREADWLRTELGFRDRSLTHLREKLDKAKSEAWLQRHRAECLDREAQHLKGQLQFMEISFNTAPVASRQDSLGTSLR